MTTCPRCTDTGYLTNGAGSCSCSCDARPFYQTSPVAPVPANTALLDRLREQAIPSRNADLTALEPSTLAAVPLTVTERARAMAERARSRR